MKRSFPVWVRLGAAVLLFTSKVAAAGSYSFTPLGIIPDGSSSQAYAVSDDGSTVVGSGLNQSTAFSAFKWTAADGMVGLPTYIGSGAGDVSGDGSVVVGYVAGQTALAVRWTIEDGVKFLGSLPSGTILNFADGVSADGAVIIGENYHNGIEAFRWTPASGMVGLGFLRAGDTQSTTGGISSDGSVVVGSSGISSSTQEAFRWTLGGGMQAIGFLRPEDSWSIADGASADGTIIVGSSGSSSEHATAFRWSENTGAIGLGFLSELDLVSLANSVSADGSIIVGASGKSFDEAIAFVWNDSTGMLNLKDFLISHGVSGLEGWRLSYASDISGDGRVIVGFGTNPNGQTEAWMVTIPEPSSAVLALLAACGIAATALRNRRRESLT